MRVTKNVGFDVAIDPIPLPEEPTRRGQSVPMLAATWLAYMTLASPRGKDRDDIVGMMQSGRVDLEALRRAVDGDDQLTERLAAALAELSLVDDD